MFRLLELLADIKELEEMGLSQEEMDGYLELFLDNYQDLFEDIDIV